MCMCLTARVNVNLCIHPGRGESIENIKANKHRKSEIPHNPTTQKTPVVVNSGAGRCPSLSLRFPICNVGDVIVPRSKVCCMEERGVSGLRAGVLRPQSSSPPPSSHHAEPGTEL